MMEDGGRPTSRTKLLVQGVLSHADRLQLSDRQIADLSRIYWATDEKWSNPNLVADIASLLSREQLSLAMSYHTTQEEMPIYPVAGSSETVREMVANAPTEQMKDKALVEVEPATKVDTGGWRPSEPGFDEALIRSISGSDRSSMEDALRRLETETRR